MAKLMHRPKPSLHSTKCSTLGGLWHQACHVGVLLRRFCLRKNIARPHMSVHALVNSVAVLHGRKTHRRRE